MKPPKFRYLRAGGLDEALEAMQTADAKVIAGGQSLVPMLNFRLLRPSLLVDINRIPGLDQIEETASGGVRVGALTRHHKIETSELLKQRCPALAAAVRHIGHLAIRNRGTIGGSLCHADPAAEHLLMAVLLEAELTVRSAQGSRTIHARDLVAGALSTTLEAQEILVAVEFPAIAPRTGWGFEEYSRRTGDFALVASAVLMQTQDGVVSNARLAVSGGANGPVRIKRAEAALRNRALDEAALDEAVDAVRESFEPNADLHASADLRHHIVGTLIRRTCRTAWQRSLGESA